MRTVQALKLLAAAAAPIEAAYSWSNVVTGGGGGFIPSIVFHPKTQGIAYARTDIGGMYKLNSDDSWTSISDGIASDATWYENLLIDKDIHTNKIEAQLGYRCLGSRSTEFRRGIRGPGHVHEQLVCVISSPFWQN
jgi:hypothetical protein